MQTEETKQLFEIIKKLHQLNQKIRVHQIIPQGEFMVLCGIERAMQKKGGVQKSVAVAGVKQFLNMSKPAISRILSSLEEKQYLIRKINQIDHRMIEIEITEKGQQVLLEKKENMMHFWRNMIERLGEKDSNELLRILQRLCEILETEEK